MANCPEFPSLVELNVGGVLYTTALTTLTQEPDSLLASIFTGNAKEHVVEDAQGRYFLDRDGILFRYILDYLRNQKLVLPENFHEKELLKQEAEYFKIPNMVKCIDSAVVVHTPKPAHLPPLNSSVPETSGKDHGCITVSYRGTFAFGRDGLADVKFRRVLRILVCGRVALCRAAFGETLNESRDPDRGTDSYTSRYFLKHTCLEQAFEDVQRAGFRLIGSCGSGTNGAGGTDSDESKWNHFNEFVFCRS